MVPGRRGKMAHRSWIVALVVVGSMALGSLPAHAQTSTGGLRGIVRDETGGVLAGVTVEVGGPALIGGPSAEVTNGQGLYRFDRLPVGIYTVTFTLQGFQTVRRENVRVEVGRTIDVDVPMTIGAVTETVAVSGAAPVVDSLHAGSTTNFNLEMLQNIPSTRTSWFDTVGFMPAVRTDLQTANSATFLVYGSNSDQNAYQFEGIDYGGLGSSSVWDFPNPDIIQELQVVGIGASAEHAGFMGGIVNLVTKSGSNNWKGRASYFFTEDNMVSNNTPGEPLPYKVNYYQDLTWELGGPIAKDRWWFAAIFELQRSHQSQVGVDLQNAPKYRRFRTFYKVNSKLSDNDSFELAYNNSHYVSAGQASRLQPPETVVKDTGHNPIFVPRWTRTLGSATVFDVKGGYFYAPDRNTPPNGDFQTPGRYDLATGQYSVNPRQGFYSTAHRPSVHASVSHYADEFIKGSHDLKFGVQLAPRNSIVAGSPYHGGVFYYDFRGAPYYALVREPDSRAGRVNSAGIFAQDNWSVTDRLTLNLGLRFDHVTGDVPPTQQRDVEFRTVEGEYPGISSLIQFDDVSPRVGVTYKLDTAGKTVGKASYGRYYGRLNTNMFVAISPGNTETRAFYYNAATRRYDRPYYTVDPNGNYDIDPNLKNQYVDQLFFGIERELMPDLGLEVQYIWKKERDFIRLRDVRGTYAAQPFVDTFRGATQTLTVFNRTSPSAQSLFQVTNRDDLKQDYNSVIVSAYKRLSGRWQLHGSYQWQRSRGFAGSGLSIGSQAFSGLGPGGYGRDPNDLTNAYGRFPTDSAHSLKANFTFQAPFDIHVGLRESYDTGRPYGRAVTVRGLGQGTRTILAEARGVYELPSNNNFQVRVDKDFRFGTTRRFRVSLDLINVFNDDVAVNVRNNSSQGETLFGQTLEVTAPRRAILGFRVEF